MGASTILLQETTRNALVGGHTCLTAGEQGEPAVVLYIRIHLSVPVGGPTAVGFTIT